jgi:predicted metalloprotease with PDZ domain
MTKTRKHATLLVLVSLFVTIHTSAQTTYQYSVDLTKVQNDQLMVELLAPKIDKQDITFYLPKIVPGTYMNSNYGKYVHNLEAFDKSAKALTVKQSGDNSWKINNAKAIYKITYKVEDTWDSDIKNMVYSMCGTSFEEGKNFVLNTPGLFGYFDGMKKMNFDLSFTKPQNFYAATGLKPVSTSSTTDRFICKDADELYDSPLMFSLPDTTTIKVGNADVLVAVYSPKKLITSKFIAADLQKLLMATKDYLGGKLPVDKYAFIYYFNGEQKPLSSSGAWEHSYSSFYSVAERPQEDMKELIVDISSHEFFHIVTPLTISSKEVKEFNFNETVLSKHLWLYEGSTEYYAHHVQVWGGLKTPDEFLQTLAEKIRNSRTQYNDSLSFTEMSKESAGKWAEQYNNVYEKGALISACLDLNLLKLSGNQYGLKDLKHDLGVKYGKDKYFNDNELFDEIGKLTWPEIKDFLLTYVQGSTPIPYEKYFDLAGVEFIPKETYRDFTLGGIDINTGEDGKITVGIKNMNAFGKVLGYQEGDKLVSLNGTAVTGANFGVELQKFYATAKEGDKVTVTVTRKTGDKEETTELTGPATKVEKTRQYVLRFNKNATPAQLKLRSKWLNTKTLTTPMTPVAADPNDVSSIDNIVAAVYNVISGPAGERDWNRFRSLFHPDAYMGATTPKKEFKKFSPEDYIKNNDPFFKKYSFTEKEISRTVNQFGNIAQVFTTYEFVAGTVPPMQQRGINSIELMNEKGRWWVMSISWEDESDVLPIPKQFLPK